MVLGGGESAMLGGWNGRTASRWCFAAERFCGPAYCHRSLSRIAEDCVTIPERFHRILFAPAALLVDPGHPNIQLSGGFDHDVREIMSFQRDDHVHQTELPAGYRRPAPLRVNRENLFSQLLNGLIDLR